ncbi:MAG: tetratricopeptide repeat protein [Candidatus Omnitrophota bacterium]|jgi:chromosome segregation ATPase
MLDWQSHKKLRILIKALCVILTVTFLSYDLAWAGATEVLSFKSLPVLPQAPFVCPTLKYLSVNEANPHNYFNFLLDKGQLSLTDKDSLNKETKQLINYFFLGITIPDDAFWVNLRPTESDRITSKQLSRTDLGRTLLEQDFRLKRDMSQYLNPQNPIGRQFWEKLYSTLGKDRVKRAGITTSNRVWIVPAEAVVVETEDGAFLVKSSLRVLLESEYAALKIKPSTPPPIGSSSDNSDSLQAVTQQLMKEIVIPAITKDVNESKNYAPLRQIYHSLILAQWFKRRHKNTNSSYAQAINKGYLKGLESQLPWEKQQIWQEYLKSYNQGEYKIQDTILGLKRMYFSGGVLFDLGPEFFPLKVISQKELPEALKQNPDLLKSNSLKDDLVVFTERQGNQDNLQEQPLVQDINIVSAQENLPKETIVQQTEKKKPELQESVPTAEASSPVNSSRSDGVLTRLTIKIKNVVHRIIKRFTKKEIQPIRDISIRQAHPQGQIEETSLRGSPVHTPRQYAMAAPSQVDNDIPLSSRQQIESRVRQLSDSIAVASKDALIKSFRPTGPAELPLPIPITMLNQSVSDRDKIIRIIENMQRMMDGTDEKVLRDFERAIDNARDRVTEQALDEFDKLSNEQLYQLLTQGYLVELQREFQRIIENQIQHMTRFHAPSPEEQNLYVSEEINERYPRLPRYLKWLLTNNPQLENDPLIRDWLNTIQARMSIIPAFPEMIQDYSKTALGKSLYLNPELAMRIIFYLLRGEDLSNIPETQIKVRIQQELARNLPEDAVVTDTSMEEGGAGILELPQVPQPRSLPAPETEKTNNVKARLKVLLEDYQRFLIKFNEQGALVKKAEFDLAELSDGLGEARKQNDKVIITALKPAVEGLSSKLRRAKEVLSRLEQEKSRYEEQINQIRKESGETGGTVLLSVEPLSLGIGAIFAVMFGIPLYITKKIIDKWYNTTAGKTLGLSLSLSTTILGYYVYYASLTPKIQQVFTDFGHTDWLQLSTFFIIWPIAIGYGMLGGKLGKDISGGRLYRKANAAFNAGKIDEAIILINEAIKLQPKDAANYRLLAECQSSKKQLDEAIASYQKALEFDPNNSVSRNNLGVMYADKGDDAKAIEHYKRSLELEATDPIVLVNLSYALIRKGQLLEAARALQHAQQIKPDSKVTEKLNEILRQTGNLPKSQRPQDLDYAKALKESLRTEREKSWLGQLDYNDNLGAVAWLGAVVAWILGGFFLYYVPYGHHWELGTTDKPATLGYIVWIGEIVVVPLLGAGLTIAGVWLSDKITSGIINPIYRYLKFPAYYKKLQKVNLLPSDELSDSDLKSVASIYARMSKEYLEQIFRSWMEAGQEEKIARLFKFGNWKSEKTRLYGDIGEYKRVSRAAASKFANTAQEQKVIFDGIDREKEKLAQKGIANAVALMKDILPQITEHSRSRNEFQYWLTLVTGLPKNILDQGSRQVLTVFNDLREFDRAKEESLHKFGINQEVTAKVKAAINVLVQRLEKDGLNYPGILKKALAEINKASRNLGEFLFWTNEVMQFDKQLWSSGSFLGLLQNLIAYVRAKEEASKKLCRNPQETSQLFQTVDSLREELKRKQVSGDVSILKDVIPRVAEASRDLAEFSEYIAVLKAFDKNMWYGTQSVLQAFNNHVGYKQARENAAAKFAQGDSSRAKFFSDVDNLRNQLVQKGFPQASDLLKDILPELTKTCRSKEEFIYWLGELVGLNTTIWRSGTQAVISNFNDLAGFKQAKEMAVNKLCANQQEKDGLARSIDLLKAKLEEKRPSCAGLIKDLILEILKDIDSLANPPYRRNDFIWWLGMCVNFEAATWHAGIKQVLAGYQELKDYIIQRRELTAKFTTNPEEQRRLTLVWDSLDKTANFTKSTSISSLRNTLTKIANFATAPKEFVFWIGTLSELNSEIVDIFGRDIETVFTYYAEKGKTRDFNHLPEVLNRYHKVYHQTVLITANLLDILTDSSIDIDKRVEKASEYIVEQKIVKLGAPANLVGLKDAVSFEQLLAISGESGFSSMLNYHWQEESSSSDDYGTSYYDTSNQPIQQIVPKMGRDGMYSYWESQHPAYYKQFLEETKGLASDFNRPNEKFRVAYDDRVISWSKEEESQVMPAMDNIQALKQLIQYLRMEWPNLYENFTEVKRELIKGRPLEEFVTSETVVKMAQQLLGKVQNWQFSDQQRVVFIIKIMEIFAFYDTADLRTRIKGATDEFNRSRLVVQYWEKVLELVLKNKWLQEKSKFYRVASRVIKQKIAILNEKLGDGGEGILQFYLSGKTMADFFRGSISSDCTAYGGSKFQDSLGTITDPAFFLFKVVEKGKWVGNIYSLVSKTQDGKFVLFVDWFKIAKDHPLASKDNSWDNKRKQFMKAFFEQFKIYLASQGFDYLIVAPAIAESGYTLYKFAQDQAKAEAKNDNPETISLKKIGNTEHLKEGALPVEYVQNFGGNLDSSFRSVSGYKIVLDKTTPQAIQQKQRDLDYLEKLLGEITAEETRLLALIKEKQAELKQINQKGYEAANSGRNTLANALKTASEQKKAEIQKVEYELSELRVEAQNKKNEVNRLRSDFGLFTNGNAQARAPASSPVVRALLSLPFTGLLGIFLSSPAYAQGMPFANNLVDDLFDTVFIIGGAVVFCGLLYYLLKGLFSRGGTEYEPYHGMAYAPRSLYEEYKLPQDVKEQLAKVLAKISPALQDSIPKRIDIHLPLEVGIRRPQAVKALRLLFSKLIEQDSVLEFLKTQPFYQDFKQRTKELGLSDDFDQPGHEYLFSVAKEEIQQEEDRRAEEFIANTLAKLKKAYGSVSADTILRKISDEKSYLSRKGLNRAKEGELYEYYLLLKAYAYLRFQEKLQGTSILSTEHKYLEAVSLLEEFLRIGIGAELIALEQDTYLRDSLNKILKRELEDVRWQFNRLAAQRIKNEQASQATGIQYAVTLSSRSADDILRGIASGDCTAINSSAFYNTIPQFLFDPGFLDFKILQDDKWVGNVYAIVAEKDNNPVLIIDAVQLPVWGRTWPVSVRRLSDKVLEQVVEYAQEQGFNQVLMSSFVSNFNAIQENFNAKYPTQAIEIEKVAGFEHLKALGIWNEYASRNEYLETFSPQWNYGLKKVDPNNPKQTLLLRRVWERSTAFQQLDEPSVEPSKASSPLEYAQKNTGGLLKFIQRNLGKVVFGAVLFIMLTLPNIAHAAKFEIMQGQQPNQTQVVAVVEKGDNLWNIAGVTYKGVEGTGQGKYAANAEWSKIYEVNKDEVLKGRQHRVGPQYPDTKQVVNIKPGDRLIIPGLVNYEAAGLKAPSIQAKAKPSTQEVKAPEVAPSKQQVKTQQEFQNLQQQKSQVGQELNQIKQQKQVAQSDLEDLQRQKAELTRQMLDLKKQLSDIQEQLRQAKEKMPSGLQSEVKQLEQNKAQYAQDISALEKQYKAAQDELARITAQKEKTSQELEQLRQKAPQAQTQIKDLQAKIQRLEAQKKQHQEEVSNLQNQSSDLQKSIAQLNLDRSKLQDELKDLQQQISDAKKILDEAKQKVQPTWKNIWDGLSWPEKAGIILLFLSGLGAITGGIILLKRRIIFGRLQEKVERLQKEAKDLETKLGTYRTEEKDFVKMKEDAEKAKLEAEEKAKEVAKQQVQLETERKRLEQEALNLQQQKQEIEKEKQKLAELERQRQAVRDEIKILETQRDSLKQSLVQAQEEAQEAIRQAKEQEENIKAQTRLTQETLTEEQRQLQERLDAKRREVSEQISVLDEQLKQARTKHELEMAGIGQERTTVQASLEGLLSERDGVENRLREMGKTIELLNRTRDTLLDDLRDLDNQRKDLQLSIGNLKKEKEKLEAEVEESKPVEEIKPEMKSFSKKVQDLREEMFRMLGEVAPITDKEISATLINQLKDILGMDAEITTIPISDEGDNENIIVRINATQGYEALPQIILNAHKDIHDHGYHIGINGKDKFIKTGALDDRVGVVSILQSLRFLKKHFGKENTPHGQILIIFTDLEEHGFVGAYDLKAKYETNSSGYGTLFDNTYLMITVDGPLDWETGDFLSDNTPFVIAGSYPKDDLRYKAIYDAVSRLNYPSSQVPRCPVSDGGGDHHVFRRIIDKQIGQNLFVVNLRAPHTGSREDYHTNKEKTDIDEHLTPFILWLTESIIQLNADLLNKKAGSAKGQGMFAPEEHAEVNEVISAAQREGRGLLIWGDAQGWKQAKDSYVQDVSLAITGLKRYPRVNIQGLGTVDIPEILATSNIILIQPRNHSPPGLVVKDKNSYQIAHSGEAFNSIYIDEKIYKQLYSFEVAVLLAHEAIELGAKRLAQRKYIPWTASLAKQVHRFAEEYEIQIVGKSPNGRGSRFDDRVEELLDFANLNRRVEIQQQPIPTIPKPQPQSRESQEQEIFIPKPQKKQEPSYREPKQSQLLEYPDEKPETIDKLRKLFMEGLFSDISVNLPAKLDNFPLPLAQEIRQAYQLGKVKGMPLSADFLVALALFFSKLFPNHADELVHYMKNLQIYLVDNIRSTYGATLSGSTFYIQKSCIEDLLGRPVTVEEIYQGIKNKDPRICVALFRIIIHEIGSAFFKLSHPANQELEEVFLAMLSKTGIKLSLNFQQEINTTNKTVNLDKLARIDWAQKRIRPSNFDYSRLSSDNIFFRDKIITLVPLEQAVSSSGETDTAVNPGGIDLSNIEVTLKDEKFVLNLNPADRKILRAARALKEGQDSLAVLYVHEVRLLVKDNILSKKEVTQKALLQNLLNQLEHKELLNLEAVAFSHIIQGEVIFAEDKLSTIGRIK